MFKFFLLYTSLKIILKTRYHTDLVFRVEDIISNKKHICGNVDTLVSYLQLMYGYKLQRIPLHTLKDITNRKNNAIPILETNYFKIRMFKR